MRQAGVGITIDAPTTTKVILRNLSVWNFAQGLQVMGTSRVVVKTSIFGSFGAGLSNVRSNGNPVIYYELLYGDNGAGSFAGPVQRRDF